MNPIATAARRQTTIAVLLLSAIGGALVGIDLAARNERLREVFDQPREEISRRTKTTFSHTGYFVDFEDRLLLDELPVADYSQGGVYLIGSSNLKWATVFWRLPKEQQAVIHNYGIGASNDTAQAQFLRHLVERDGLLSAGGNKNLVILGTSYHHLAHDVLPGGFFVSLWERHGLFTYDPTDGIQPVKMSDFVRFLIIERVRVTSFLAAWKNRMLTKFSEQRWGAPELRVRQHDRQAYCVRRFEFMGKAWRAKMQDQIRTFSRTIDYLRRNDAHVAVVLLPHGSWEDSLPFQRIYRDKLVELCRMKEVSLHDWSDLLEDEAFADSIHVNLSGMEALQEKFMEIALPHLHKSGALPQFDD